MLEFEILQELEPNAEILEIIKNYDFTIKNAKIKHLKASNLQFNVIIHWLSNKDTALYVGLWEELNNENFNFTEYREIRINEIGTSSYTMSPKQWIQRTNAIGLISKGGKYSIGTYAHPDLACEFAS